MNVPEARDARRVYKSDEQQEREELRRKNLERIAAAREGAKLKPRKPWEPPPKKPPGVPIGSTKKARAPGSPKCVDQVRCSCGVVHRRGSPAHETHVRHFPELCKKGIKR